MKQKKKRVHLSMKLLWKIYIGYKDQGINGNVAIVNFLHFVESSMKTP
jgi:hypothetical protein